MINFIFSAIFLFLLSGCNSEQLTFNDEDSVPRLDNLNPEIESYVIEFENLYNVQIEFNVSFSSERTGGSDGQNRVIGVCEVWSNGNIYVYLNPDWWYNEADDIARKVLIFHELGHCQFNRPHDSRTYPSGKPYSLMYPIINPLIIWFPIDTNFYLQELSTQSQPATFSIQYFFTTEDACFKD